MAKTSLGSLQNIQRVALGGGDWIEFRGRMTEGMHKAFQHISTEKTLSVIQDAGIDASDEEMVEKVLTTNLSLTMGTYEELRNAWLVQGITSWSFREDVTPENVELLPYEYADAVYNAMVPFYRASRNGTQNLGEKP